MLLCGIFWYFGIVVEAFLCPAASVTHKQDGRRGTNTRHSTFCYLGLRTVTLQDKYMAVSLDKPVVP